MEADALSRIQWKDPLVVKAVLQKGRNTDTAIPEPFEMTILAKNVQLAKYLKFPIKIDKRSRVVIKIQGQ